ncbi:protein-disulfide reductase DsbD [Caenimonas terrae]|uniref:Thiol:disulfide interchange protein DsbD n=1 Tax=Caenimonas terrae TaxID=696074 RepID=A0ABW0N9L0_9BURK
MTTLSPFRRQLARLALGVLLAAAAAASQAEEGFMEPEQAFQLAADQPAGGAGLALNWTIAPGYYLYRDRLTVTAGPGEALGPIVRPAGQSKADPNFGQVEVYHDRVSLQVDTGRATSVQVSWQGCAEAGLCYPPQHRTVALQPGAGAAPPAATAGTAGAGDSGITRMLAQRSLLWTLPLFFLTGIALAFTPCVLPMAPIVSGIVVGSQATPRRAFALSLAFVLAMAAVYASLGLAAAMAGAGLQALLQNPWTVLAFAAVFVLLALPMFGLFELQLPALLRDRLATAGPRRGGSIGGAAGMGVLSALLVGPCMTAPLAGTLLYIAQSGNLVQGALLLLALGLGMGVPLLVLGTVGARYLPRPGPWMDRVKAGFGFVLLATAAWMAARVVPEPVVLLLWGGLLVGLALALWHIALAPHAAAATGARVLLRSGAVLAGLWGGALVLGAAAGATDPMRPLAPVAAARAGALPAARPAFETITDPQVLQLRLGAARAAGKPALVDYYADWCTSCKTLEQQVFADPQVLQALQGVVLLRADVTASDAPQRALMQRHQVMGPPTVLLFDRQGLERRDSRLVGEFSAADLLQRQPAPGKPS